MENQALLEANFQLKDFILKAPAPNADHTQMLSHLNLFWSEIRRLQLENKELKDERKDH